MKMLSIVVALMLASTVGHAGLTVRGGGEDRTLDPAGFPSEMQERYALMEAKCSTAKCHSLGRVVQAVTTGVAPMSGTAFDKEAAKKYGIKMMRKPDSGVDRKDAKALVELMYFLLDEAGR